MRDLQAFLCALYLPGTPSQVRVSRSGWRSALSCVRRRAEALGQIGAALRKEGLWPEALAWESPGVASWGERQVDLGRALTAEHEEYPKRWIDRLGAAAPPALWLGGEVALPKGPLLSVVGSRRVDSPILDFARAVGLAASALGYVVVSGGAEGCDQAAISSASAIEILPHGSECPKRADLWTLSARAPGEPFSRIAAMERNALIYAASEFSVVCHARLREGGTWHGAIEANRRRLTRLGVRLDPTDPASRALCGLGAVPIASPADLAEAIASGQPQASLFGEVG